MVFVRFVKGTIAMVNARHRKNRKEWTPVPDPHPWDEETEDAYEPLPPLPPYDANARLKENPGD